MDPEPQEELPRISEQTMFKMRLFCGHLRRTGSVKQAHTAVNVEWDGRYTYRLREKYPQFRQMWDQALDEFGGRLHAKLTNAALGEEEWAEKPNIHALIQMNRAHNPELFAPQVRHQGQVTHYHTLVPLAQSLDALPLAQLPEEEIEEGDYNDLSDLYIEEGDDK